MPLFENDCTLLFIVDFVNLDFFIIRQDLTVCIIESVDASISDPKTRLRNVENVCRYMNRKTVIDLIIRALEARFETAKAAAQQAREAAINEESVAETKYDTFGLESSYLAHGQSQRVIECENDWMQFSRQVPVEGDAKGKVALWSLIRLVPLNSSMPLRYFFISNIAGGLSLQYQSSSLVLVSPETPVGKILLSQEEGECISLTLAGKSTEFEIDLIQ